VREGDERSIFASIGAQARWKMIYPLLVAAEVGGPAVSYQDFGDALGLHPLDDRAVIAAVVRHAGRELLKAQGHAVEVVPKIGYRVVEPNEHLRLAKQRNRRAGTQLKRGQEVVQNTDLNLVDEEARRGIEILALALSQQAEINRRQERKAARMDAALKRTAARTEENAEQLSEVQRRIQDIESRLNAKKQ
jgi:hypothetical protein